MNERQGVEIDYCPKCRGVWLDRGELDKLIERSEQYVVPKSEQPTQEVYPPTPPTYGYDKHGGYSKHGGYGKRRKGLLGELFDF
jgi:Zn-finger nucleic acid-binding protein